MLLRWLASCNGTTGLYVVVILLSLPLLSLMIHSEGIPSSSSFSSAQVIPPPQHASENATLSYYIVGVRTDVEFSKTIAQAWRLQDLNLNSKFTIRSFALPTPAKLDAWVKRTVQHPAGALSASAPLVFRGNMLLGSGIGALKLDLKQNGLKWMLTAPRPAAKDTTAAPIIKTTRVAAATSSPTTAAAVVDDGLLPIQVTLKSEIITGYRLNRDKSFTNYRPLAQYLVSQYGWQFSLQSPLLAGVILVQDQTTAAAVATRYPRVLLNNIGWNGQSCLGGTKGTQLACRAGKAMSDGCDYESLQIQPAHYRLWVQEECNAFFHTICAANPQDLFILKPSGGQHGSGIKVHQGCDALRLQFPDCADETFLVQHKFFISPYITPVLLDGHKFDMRTFAVIGSLDPLLCFYGDGFVRKATTKFATSNLKDSSAHVTNSLTQDLAEDHFWDFTKLNKHLNDHTPELGRDYVFTRFRSRAKKVTEFFFRAAQQVGFKKQHGRFQLFAADWILDDKGVPYLLEVNSNPLVPSTPPNGLEEIFPKVWGELMDLVLQIHTGQGGRLAKRDLVPYKYTFKNWHLVLNNDMQPEYNTCRAFQPERKNTKQITCPGVVNATTTTRKTCLLAQGTEDETTYHVMYGEFEGPTVVVLAGMHGNEGAGVIAARYVASHITPLRGTLVVIERANARGVTANLRHVPPTGTSAGYDLNRAFTAESVVSGKPLIIALWKLLLSIQPDYYFDMHEGRAAFASFPSTAHLSVPQTEMLDNVGSTTGAGAGAVSKGNSIVTTVNAYSLAQQIADETNERIPERLRKIYVMGPPIKGGLASMLSTEFPESKIMLFESTLNSKLGSRAKQHLFMLGVALKSEQMLDDTFNADEAIVEDCVATRKGCEL